MDFREYIEELNEKKLPEIMSGEELADFLYHKPSKSKIIQFFKYFADPSFNGEFPGNTNVEIKRLKKKGYSNKEIEKIRGIAVKATRLAWKDLVKKGDVNSEWSATSTEKRSKATSKESFTAYIPWVNAGEQNIEKASTLSKKIFLDLIKKII